MDEGFKTYAICEHNLWRFSGKKASLGLILVVAIYFIFII